MREISSLFDGVPLKWVTLMGGFHAALEKPAYNALNTSKLISATDRLTKHELGIWARGIARSREMADDFSILLPTAFNVAKFLGRRVVLALITIAGAAIFIAEQIIEWSPSFAAQPPVLMVLGDSLVAGHGLPQGEAFPEILGQMLRNDGFDVRMVNAGVSGDTTAGGLARLDWSLADNPDAVIIVLGGNDLLRGLDPSASFENLDKIIKRLKARNIAVLLAGMQAPRNFGADYADEFDAVYQKLVSRHDVLFYPFFLDGVALQPMMNLADGMHPNQAGISHIATKNLPQVKSVVVKNCEIKSGQLLIVDGSMFEKTLHHGARCHKKRPVTVIRSRFIFSQ